MKAGTKNGRTISALRKGWRQYKVIRLVKMLMNTSMIQGDLLGMRR